ncbi:MAG: efflux transporter outer membrane subunit [Burkholderiaceae bacterium]|nr:efflux transporter outer membrane subunit [Burkholderiaceae bacterium]
MAEPSSAFARALLPLAVALALAGCSASVPRAAAVGPLPVLTVPAGVPVVPGLQIGRWWTLFGDAELDRLVAQALQHNADLAVAAARLREARSRFDELRGAELPTLELQASAGRLRASAEASGSGQAFIASNQQVKLAAQFDVDLWGRLASATDAAGARLAAQAWARAAVEWSLSAQLAEAHFRHRALQRQIDIAAAVRDGRARAEALRRIERAAGGASELELRRAEAERAGAAATLAALQRQRLAAVGVIALLAGDAPSALGTIAAAAAPLDPTLDFMPRLPQGELADWLRQRPDLRQAESLLAAADADTAAARAALLPSLRLTGNAGGDAVDLSHLFDWRGFAWSMAAGLAQPIFDGGQLRTRVQQAEARADAALAQYGHSVANALVEIRDAYAALDIAQRALAAERERVAALDRATRLARLGEQAGATTQLDVLDAERQQFQAQLAEVDAYRDRLIGQVAVFKALGGGHDADPRLVGQGRAAPEPTRSPRGARRAFAAARGQSHNPETGVDR